jgi:hypothetical protein
MTCSERHAKVEAISKPPTRTIGTPELMLVYAFLAVGVDANA